MKNLKIINNKTSKIIMIKISEFNNNKTLILIEKVKLNLNIKNIKIT